MLKTLYARYGNVKVQKFVATQEEMQSSDYNPDEFEGINDLETVLDSLGIKLRESATEWRDFDQVIQDIAKHWDTWDLTTKNAVSTAFAGTRQRENFLTLMDSWEDAEKYADIASNAYGTATTKMEAYTDSVEAAQQRIKVAAEQWSLFLDSGEALKSFYNAVGFATENIQWLITIIGGLVILSNLTTTIGFTNNMFSKFGTKMADIGMIFDKVKISVESFKESLDSSKVDSELFRNEDWAHTKKSLFKNRTKKLNLTESQAIAFGEAQNFAFSLPVQKQEKMVKMLSGDFRFDKNKKLNEDTKNISETLLRFLDNDTKKNSDIIPLLRKLADGDLNTVLQQEQEQLLNNTLTELRKRDSSFTEFINQLKESTNMGDANQASKRGLGMFVGGGIGAYGGQAVGKELLGEGFGQVIGGSLGSLIGATSGKALAEGAILTFAKGLPTVFSGSATEGIVSALGGASVVGGVISLVITALAAGFAYWKKRQEELLKDAQNSFKEAEEKYSQARGTKATSVEYDKLVKGVDSFGRNVSLTDEEYQKFLDISNELAQVFPSLIVKIDENGNKLIGYGNVVGAVADEVERLNKELQEEADSKLLNKTLFEDSFKNTYSEIRDLEIKNSILKSGNYNALKKEEKKELFDKYNLNENSTYEEKEKALQLEAKENNKQIEASKAEMRDFIMAEVRKLQNSAQEKEYSDVIQKMSEEERAVYDNIVKSLDLRKIDENGLYKINPWNDEYVLKSEEEIQNELKQMAKNVNSLTPDITKIAFKPDIEYKNIKEMNTNRQKVIDKILEQFFDDDGKIDAQENQIIVGLGFEVVGDKIEDPQNILEKFKNEFGIEEKNDLQGISLENLSVLSLEDAKKTFDFFNEGIINTTDSMETLVNLLYAERDMPHFLEGAEEYTNEMVDLYSNLEEKTRNFFSGDNWKNQNVNESFSEYPAMVRTVIEEAQKEWNNGKVDVEQFFESIRNIASSQIVNIMGEFARIEMESVFGEGFLGDIDGHINTLNELQSSLREVANTYKTLGEAQKEQSLYGELSLQTVTSLLAENIKYAQVLDFTTDAENGNAVSARLKADAQQIMVNVQLEAIKTSLQAAMAEEAHTISLNNQRLAVLGDTKGQIQLQGTTGNLIDINNAAQVSFAQLGAVLNGVGAALNALIHLESFGNVQKAYNDAYNSTLIKAKELEKVNWKKYYEGLSEDKVQEEIDALTQSNKDAFARYETYQMGYNQIDKAITTGDYGRLGTDFKKDNSKSGSSAKDNKNKEDEFKSFEPNKEWEAMQAKEYNRYTEYFIKKEKSLKAEEAHLKAQYKTAETEKERLEITEKLQELHVKLKNLNDEEVQDQINLLESRKASIEAIIIQYETLLKTADTEEELIQYQEKLNDKLREQFNIRKKINDYQNELINIQLKYKSGTAYSNSSPYDSMIQQQTENYRKSAEIAQQQIRFETQKAYESYLKDVDDLGNKLYTTQEAWLKAQNSEKVQEATKEYIQAVEAQAELAMKSVTDKIDEISREIDRLEKQKPQEWSSFDQIKEYSNNTIEYLNKKLSVIQDALKDTNNLTDEQIINLVNQLNEVTIAIHEAQIAMHEGIKDRQESIYSALINQVQRYIDELERAKDAVEEAYKDPVKDIEDYNKALDRTNKLLELQNKLKTAQREKKRVYREGIGWVFESDREKVKEAQKDLDDFYRNDKLNDLEEAKNNELALLDERIEGWNRYLQALKERYEQWQVQEEQKLLMELTNANSEQELHQKILEDMLNYNQQSKGMYDDYIGIFQNFLAEYKVNLQELQALKQQELTLTNPNALLGGNSLENKKPSGGSYGSGGGGSGKHDYTSSNDDPGVWGSDAWYESQGKEPPHKDHDNNDKNSGGDIDWGIIPEGPEGFRSRGLVNSGRQEEKKKIKKYSTGLESGPVTYTGIAMLHGSSSEPEYVLNNDQAYNLLYNMSTRRIADFESTQVKDKGVQYIVQGDIVLEGVNDPEKFWKEVTKAMGNRWNVTKNR